MQKRIAAICLVILMLSVLLVSCGNKYLLVEINGVKRPLVTDAEGNTNIDSDGKLEIYVTDSKGNLILDDNGNPKVEYFQLPDKIVDKHSVETNLYKLTMPNDWKLSDNGIFYKNGTDDKCYINCIMDKELSEDETYDTYLAENEETQQKYIEDFKELGLDASMDVATSSHSSGNRVTFFEYKVNNDKGEMIHYAASAYFLFENSVYSVNYVCTDGVGYDETFDFQEIVNTCFTVK